MPVQTAIQVRRGTASSWTSTNPTLAAGEIGFESDTGKIKIGTGSATWSSLAYANIPQSTIDAKGDLLVGSANDTVTRLAAGSSGDSLVADSAATTGLRWQGNFVAGKNKILNSDFTISQRASTFSAISSSQYILDRWRFENNGTGTATISQTAFTPGAAPVAGYESPFFLKMTANSVGTSTNFDITQRIEDVRTFANQTITISFWAKADSARTVTPILGQNYGSGGSSSDFTFGTGISVSTSWARYSQTFNVPSISGKTVGSSSFFQIFLRTTAATGLVLDLWGVQVEAGSVATAFQTATGTIQGELDACMRYFTRYGSSAAFSPFGTGFCITNAALSFTLPYRVRMRTTPSLSFSAGNTFATYSAGGAVTAGTSMVLDRTGDDMALLTLNVASGLSSGQAANAITNGGSTAFIDVSAEL